MSTIALGMIAVAAVVIAYRLGKRQGIAIGYFLAATQGESEYVQTQREAAPWQ